MMFCRAPLIGLLSLAATTACATKVQAPRASSAPATAHGVPHELYVDHGGHVQLDRFANDAIPFFVRTLAGASGRSASER